MKRIITILTASLLASAVASSPAFAQGKSGKAMGNHKSASEFAPGQRKKLDSDNKATEFAPGQVKGDDESAKDYAPGQMKSAADGDEIDPDTTASTGQPNFGTVISSIRAGKSDVSGVTGDTAVNVVSVDDLIEGNNRVALDNAIEDNGDQIERLRRDLGAVDGLEGLTEEQIDAAVAARVEADGSLTVYTD